MIPFNCECAYSFVLVRDSEWSSSLGQHQNFNQFTMWLGSRSHELTIVRMHCGWKLKRTTDREQRPSICTSRVICVLHDLESTVGWAFWFVTSQRDESAQESTSSSCIHMIGIHTVTGVWQVLKRVKLDEIVIRWPDSLFRFLTTRFVNAIVPWRCIRKKERGEERE